MKIFKLFFVTLIVVMQGAYAEVEEVSIRWRNNNCTDTCHALLEKQFKSMSGALDAKVDGKGGIATMRWKPRMKFRYSDINLAIRMVGVPLLDIQIKARGTITHSGKRFTLESIGDDTNFILLSPLEVKPNRMAVPQNVDSYSISPETQKKLLDSELGFYVVSVSGVLLMPERSPPYYLIIEKIEGGAPETAPVIKKPGSMTKSKPQSPSAIHENEPVKQPLSH